LPHEVDYILDNDAVGLLQIATETMREVTEKPGLAWRTLYPFSLNLGG
jgi:hypothetical protein